MPVIFTVLSEVILKFIKENFRYILLALVLLAGMLFLSNWLKNYYTADLKEKSKAKDVVIEVFKQNEKNLLDTIYNIQSDKRIDLDSLTNNIQEKKNIDESSNASERKLDNSVSDIRREYSDLIEQESDARVKIELMVKKEKRISEERINSLWDSFCSTNKTDPDCK